MTSVIEVEPTNAACAQKRWRLQLSLRALFVVTTVLASLLAVVLSQVDRQRRSVEAITRAGGYVEYEYRSGRDELNESYARQLLRAVLPNDYIDTVKRVHLENCYDFGDSDLARLKDKLRALDNIEKLYLDNTKVSDAGLIHLYGLSSLESIGLHGTFVTPGGAEILQAELPHCAIYLD
jgi:hypothetical protein